MLVMEMEAISIYSRAPQLTLHHVSGIPACFVLQCLMKFFFLRKVRGQYLHRLLFSS